MISISALVWCALSINIGMLAAKIAMILLTKDPRPPRTFEIAAREMISETVAVWTVVLAATMRVYL